MAIYLPSGHGAADRDAEFLMDVLMVPVIAATHALARNDFGRHA